MSLEIGAAAIDRAESLDASLTGPNISFGVISLSNECIIDPGCIGHITDVDVYLTEATTQLRFGIAYQTTGGAWRIRSFMNAAVSGTVGPGLVTVSNQDLVTIDGDVLIVYARNLHLDMGDTGSGYVKLGIMGNPFTLWPDKPIGGTTVSGKTLSLYAHGYIETPKLVTGQYEKFENNEFNDDSSDDFSNTNFVCQTFTVGTIHKLHRVEMKLISTSNCGTVTMGIFATDSTGAPTGSALELGHSSRVPEITSSAEWVTFNLNCPIILEPKTYAIVLLAEAGGAWARYEAIGSYTAGYLWESTDSGATWVKQIAPDLLFREYGTLLESSGSYAIHLYPQGEGTHTQLVPAFDFKPATLFQSDIENYSCVDDLAGAPDENSTSIMYAVSSLRGGWELEHDWENFLSGESEGRSGRLSLWYESPYNYVLWQCGIDGITSPSDSLFTKQLEVGDILRSPTHNEWYGKYKPRLSRVLSIQDDMNLTLSEAPSMYWGTGQTEPARSWYATPCSRATADDPPVSNYPISYQNLPFNYLTGQWSWKKNDHVVYGVGGNAESELVYPAVVFHAETIDHGRSQTGLHRAVELVTDDNTFETWVAYAWKDREDPVNKTRYLSLTFRDNAELDDAGVTSTQFCKPTKRDSYTLKSTLNTNPIVAVQVVARVSVALMDNPAWKSVTGTAQPFLKLNGLDSLGTEVEIPSVQTMGITFHPDGTITKRDPVWFTIRQTISRPGGGVFTRDDINSMEVGIILGNIGGTVKAYTAYDPVNAPDYYGNDPINAPAVVACTQLYADVIMSSQSGQQSYQYYITQYGQKVFDNGFDEWALPVFNFNMNQSTHWIYGTLISDFIAKPISILRNVISKTINRHRVSRSIVHGKTSKEI